MANILHVVNGDSTAEILQKTALIGHIVVWREVLCEGPICNNIGSDDFWKLRYAFYEDTFNISKLEYFDKSIKEIVQLEDVSNYTDVVLWFEYDLFCQVNLMGLCAYLIKSFRKDVTYHLICTGFVKGKNKLQSLNEFSKEDYQKLFDEKVKITRHNLLYAKECWEIYVKNNLNELKAFNFNSNPKFEYFQLAINQHLKTFPLKNGLNEIENKILEIINNEPLLENEIIKKVLSWQANETIYGFGDLQYASYLKNLQPYYTIYDSKFHLNKLGLLKVNES